MLKQEITFQCERIIIKQDKKLIWMKDTDKLLRILIKGIEDASLDVRTQSKQALWTMFNIL